MFGKIRNSCNLMLYFAILFISLSIYVLGSNCGQTEPPPDPPFETPEFVSDMLDELSALRKKHGISNTIEIEKKLCFMASKHTQYLIDNIPLENNLASIPNCYQETSGSSNYSGNNLSTRAKHFSYEIPDEYLFEIIILHKDETETNYSNEDILENMVDSVFHRAKILQPNVYKMGYSIGNVNITNTTSSTSSITTHIKIYDLILQSKSGTGYLLGLPYPLMVRYPEDLESETADCPLEMYVDTTPTSDTGNTIHPSNMITSVQSTSSTGDVEIGYPISLHFQLPPIEGTTDNKSNILKKIAGTLTNLSTGVEVEVVVKPEVNGGDLSYTTKLFEVSNMKILSDIYLFPQSYLEPSTEYEVNVKGEFYNSMFLFDETWRFTTGDASR